MGEDKKLKPDTKKPEPSEAVNNVVGNLVEFNRQDDHLTVHLSLPSPPVHSNGRWDEALKQVVWETHIEDRTNAKHLPFSCYASWAQADEDYQKKHLGKVALIGNELTQYCLWRSSLDMQWGDEWDAFLRLTARHRLIEKLDAFRFSSESGRRGQTTNRQFQACPFIRANSSKLRLVTATWKRRRCNASWSSASQIRRDRGRSSLSY